MWPFYLLLSIPRLEYYQQQLDRFLIKQLSFTGMSQSYLELTSCVVMLVLLTQLIRLYTTFFFGRTLGQILLGLKCQGSFWWVRIIGVFRLLLEILLAPLLIGHLFILFKGRSMHEMLTGSEIKLKLFKLRPGAGVLAVTVMLLNFLFSASALNISDYHDFKYVKTKVTPLELKEVTDFSQFKEHSSITFGISAFTSLEKSGFFLLPSLEVRKVGERLLKGPVLYLIDKNEEAIGKLTIELKFDAKNLLKISDYANPFILKRYPALFEKEEASMEDVSNQFVDLLDQIFNLSYRSLPNKILGLGPILLGPAKLRRRILRFLSNTATVQVQRVQLNRDRFLRLQQLFESDDKDIFSFQETFIALEHLNGKVLQVKWGRNENDAKARENFQREFLSTISLNDGTWSERSFQLETRWGAFDIIDGFMKTKLSNAEKIKLRGEILLNLLEAKHIVQDLKNTKTANELKKIIVQTINRFLFLQKNKNGNLTDAKFRNQLITLKNEFL